MHPETESREQNLLTALADSRKALGAGIPRLITQKPQIAMNAIKHQLTGQSLFMPPAELTEYLRVGMQMIQEMEPVGTIEAQFAQRIIDTNWSLNRGRALEPILFNASVADASRSLTAANPGESEDTVLVNAQAVAYRKDCADLFEKLGRHVSRMERSLRNTMADFKEMRSARITKRGNQYNAEKCIAYSWYRQLAELADRLIEARHELKTKSTEQTTPAVASGENLTTSAATTSNSELFCKTELHIHEPLTQETEATLEEARKNGLLIGSERTLITKPAAA